MLRVAPIACALCLLVATGCEGDAANDQEPDAVRPAHEAKEFIRVEVQGTLEHGVFAIGGETTGTTITARGVTWELDLCGNEPWLAEAERLSGRLARVEGTLERRAGVEIAQRWIVTVERLAAAD